MQMLTQSEEAYFIAKKNSQLGSQNRKTSNNVVGENKYRSNIQTLFSQK